MKKQILIISVLIIIISIFVFCSANSSSENFSTTAVTDSKGTTHYYEPVTDDKGNISTTEKEQGVYAEIETHSNGKYVTNEHTTVLTIENVTDSTSSTTKSATEKSSENDSSNADNDIEFEPDETTSDRKPNTTTTTTQKQTTTTTETTTEKEIPPATNKDGWITKWY